VEVLRDDSGLVAAIPVDRVFEAAKKKLD